MTNKSKPTAKELKEYKEAFEIFDENKDGKIDVQELGRVIRSLGKSPTETELNDMIKEFDIDENGTIELSEFVTMMHQKKAVIRGINIDSEEDMREYFKIFDKDGNGFISPVELRESMAKLGTQLSDKELDEMIKMADTNADGQVSYEEFVMLMKDGIKDKNSDKNSDASDSCNCA